MTLYVNGIEKTITLCPWEGDHWGCDCFNDLECNIADGSDVTAEGYANIVEYWQGEVDAYNSGAWSEQFGDPSESRIKEFGFWAD